MPRIIISAALSGESMVVLSGCDVVVGVNLILSAMFVLVAPGNTVETWTDVSRSSA